MQYIASSDVPKTCMRVVNITLESSLSGTRKVSIVSYKADA